MSPENEQFLDRAVATGMYRDRTQAINAAVELLRRREQILQNREQLIRDVNIGIEQLERGEGAPLDIEGIKAKVREASHGD